MEPINSPQEIPSSTIPPKPFVPWVSDQEVAIELIQQGLSVAEAELRQTHNRLRQQQPLAPGRIPQTSAPISRHPSRGTTERQWEDWAAQPPQR